MRWWQATKSPGPSPGVLTVLCPEARGTCPGRHSGRLIFHGRYTGRLPKSARDGYMPAWVSSAARQCQIHGSDRFMLRLRFGVPGPNLDDVACGCVKHVIDCLHPLVGGTPGKPEDWRIDSLSVEKGSQASVGLSRSGCLPSRHGSQRPQRKTAGLPRNARRTQFTLSGGWRVAG
jgi:hypothetical protein